ncbi:TetR/AcrR family transcriptional regulator [Actinomadura sp. WMMB 499]|uniref:TetR/AcrR family transcriptional regulator n=1 Tax=Actinomadura sp. WMMB 499 TaxID=1219491 RepID=UPI0012476CAF|nr:TetR/AcrR family transcriptional regulator [Actinomadura sp. WMMB 499]QFG23823.1 TetR/AcrR family transcriptional regulator [Actinomadura sp. WMMB 499]
MEAIQVDGPPGTGTDPGTGGEARPPVRKRDREATRQRILDAARDLFGEHGYGGVTIRMIAAEADANTALVHRYFGSKADLFAEVLSGESVLRGVIAGGPEDLPRRLAEYFAHQVEHRSTTSVSRLLDRSAGHPEVKQSLLRYLEDSIVEPMVAQLDGPNPRARALLASTILMGGGPVRRLFGLNDLREADPDELTERLTTMFSAALAP